MNVNKPLVQQLLQLGDREGARKEIMAALRANPKDVDAWLLMAQADDDPAHQKDCYRQILKIDPNNLEAQIRLRDLSMPAARASTPSQEQTQPQINAPPPGIQPALKIKDTPVPFSATRVEGVNYSGHPP